MRIDILTIFPRMFDAVLGESILKRAQASGRLRVAVHDLRRWTRDKHHSVDDRPYGGGPGMVMKPGPIFEALEDLRRDCQACLRRASRAVSRRGRQAHAGGCQTLLMSPRGEPLCAAAAEELVRREHLIIICGHYEGVDERVLSAVDRSMSIGDYVLTGGELPAMVTIDALARFIPGVIGHEQATAEESFAGGWLEYPQYTRPERFRGMAVPQVLLSGDHGQVAAWRRRQAARQTARRRPDLLKKARLPAPRARQAGNGTQRG
ncbi:MAG: tRNA (guanosine(37)-N1)-methyltransferase TrmD [Candidatus Omnitrophica bacterium]|nr:tRNA (guanosine(37)-N1)-methyltransferase TrmD [Candidatus Omnitrophota bacterium]